MNKGIPIIAALLLLALFAVPASAAAAAKKEKSLNYTVTDVESYTAYVKTKGSRLSVRLHPKTDARVLGKLPNGSELTVIGETEYFYKVTAGDLTGFVLSRYVTKDDPLEGRIPSYASSITNASFLYPSMQALEPTLVTVRVPWEGGVLNMRRGPARTEKLVKYLKDGSILTALATDGVWVQVMDNRTYQTGYVMTDYLYGL